VPSGHELPLRLRAGIDTAEWALERADVKPVAMHRAAPVFESFEAAGFQGYRYVAELPLPGRYLVDGIRLTRLAGRGRFTLSRLALRDGTRAPQPLSALAAFVSDSGLFTETAAAPDVRLFSLVRPQGIARVVAGLRVLDSQTELLQVLAQPTASGFDARAQALGLRSDLDGVQLDGPAHASRADVVRVAGSRIDLRAEGRGLLVVAEGWDAGWSARLDGAPARLLRLNHAQMGLLLGPGPHRVALRYRPVGLRPGIGLAGCGVALLFGLARRSVTAMKAATAGGPED
jgi:hypothetical protein